MSRNGTSSMERRLDALKESVRHIVDAGSERMSDVKDTVMSSGRHGAKRASSVIKDHPFLAIGIAFGVGYLAVRILRR